MDVEIPLLNVAFLAELVKALPAYTAIEKQTRLLKALEKMTEYPGQEIVLTPREDASLSWVRNEKEFRYYIESLIDRGLIGVASRQERPLTGLTLSHTLIG